MPPVLVALQYHATSYIDVDAAAFLSTPDSAWGFCLQKFYNIWLPHLVIWRQVTLGKASPTEVSMVNFLVCQIITWAQNVPLPNCHICAVIPPGAVWKEKEGRLSSSSDRPHHLIQINCATRNLSFYLKSRCRQNCQYRWECDTPANGICPNWEEVFPFTGWGVVHLLISYEQDLMPFSGFTREATMTENRRKGQAKRQVTSQ